MGLPRDIIGHEHGADKAGRAFEVFRKDSPPQNTLLVFKLDAQFVGGKKSYLNARKEGREYKHE